MRDNMEGQYIVITMDDGHTIEGFVIDDQSEDNTLALIVTVNKEYVTEGSEL